MDQRPLYFSSRAFPFHFDTFSGLGIMKKTQINPFDSKSENRYEAFRQMRAEAPVHETSTGARFIVSQQAVSDGLKSVESFVGSFGNTGQTAEEDTVMAAIAEPRHAKIRKLFNSALGFHHVSKIVLTGSQPAIITGSCSRKSSGKLR